MVEQAARRPLARALGLDPAPDKTPMNLRDLGVAASGTVNNVQYEVRKIVTANLYLPLGVRSPVPCVIFTYGHGGGKSQHASRAMAFVSQGVAAFVMFRDGQIADPTVRDWVTARGFAVAVVDPRHVGDTMVPNPPSPDKKAWDQREPAKWTSPWGRPAFGEQVFDLRRVVGYLELRDEIDPGRIAVAGLGGYAQPVEWERASYFMHPMIPIHVAPCEGGRRAGGRVLGRVGRDLVLAREQAVSGPKAWRRCCSRCILRGRRPS